MKRGADDTRLYVVVGALDSSDQPRCGLLVMAHLVLVNPVKLDPKLVGSVRSAGETPYFFFFASPTVCALARLRHKVGLLLTVFSFGG